MPYEDIKRVTALYKAVFGWQIQGLGGEMGEKGAAKVKKVARKQAK